MAVEGVSSFITKDMLGNTENNARHPLVEQEELPVRSLALATDRPTMLPAVDPEAEWNQRLLAGLKRMDTDPAFREAVSRRVT